MPSIHTHTHTHTHTYFTRPSPEPCLTCTPLSRPSHPPSQVKRELNSLEEEVPWTAVDVAKWRAARKAWQKRLKAAGAASMPPPLGAARIRPSLMRRLCSHIVTRPFSHTRTLTHAFMLAHST